MIRSQFSISDAVSLTLLASIAERSERNFPTLIRCAMMSTTSALWNRDVPREYYIM
jgi:hypothetical protein